MPDDAGAETAEIVCVGKIDIPAFLKLGFLRVGQKRIGQALRILIGQDRGLKPDRLQNAVAPPDGPGVHPQVDVGGVRFLPDTQVMVHVIEGLMHRLGGGRVGIR